MENIFLSLTSVAVSLAGIVSGLQTESLANVATSQESGINYELVESDGYYYILGIGQSNMYGRDRAGDQTSADLTPNDMVEVWNPASESWEVGEISDRFDPITGMDRGGNMAWFAAKELNKRTGVPVRVVIDAVGGRPIEDWVANGTSSVRYASAVEQLVDANVPEVDLIIFAQGESNNDNCGVCSEGINTKSEYRAALDTLLSQLRAEPMVSSETRFTMPELAKVDGSEVQMYHRNDVILDLNRGGDPKTFATRASDTGRTYPLVANDDVHWTLSGLEILGKRVVNAYNKHKQIGVSFYELGLDAQGYAELNVGNNANERMRGNGTNQIFFGEGGKDNIAAGQGFDYVFGGRGNDVLWSNSDYVFGGPEADFLTGAGSSDVLHGGSGNDSMAGGTGNDLLIGGEGNDRFWFRTNQGVDVIADFEIGRDQLGFRSHELYHRVIVNDEIGFKAFIDRYVYQVGYDTHISTIGRDNANNTIILESVDSSQLSEKDFIF